MLHSYKVTDELVSECLIVCLLTFEEVWKKKKNSGGASVAQPAQCQTLGLGSGHDLMGLEIEPPPTRPPLGSVLNGVSA